MKALPRSHGSPPSEPAIRRNPKDDRDLEAELEAARRLQRVSTELIRGGETGPLYERLLDAAVAIMRSDFASVQVLDPERNALRLLAFRGFHPESANYWYWVKSESSSTCGRALAEGGRIIIQDVETCDWLVGTETLEHYHRNGIRSVQSTPLLTRDGALIGMMSTHWLVPHEPAERDLQLFDVLARQVADLIERIRAESVLRANQRRQTFLLEMHDALRTLAEPAQIQSTAARLLGEHLGVQRVTYSEIEGETAHIRGSYERGVEPLPAHFAYRVFGNKLIERFERGESVTVEDIEISPLFEEEEREALRRIEVCAFVALVLIKDGRWVASFVVQSATPRMWTEVEISLVHETAERTWAVVERARAEQALRQSEARLRDMDRRKDEFLATLAHELRNPLAPIRNSLNILRVSGSDVAPDALLDILDRQVGHMVRLVDDLMEVSRITRGQIELRKERIDLVTVVRSAIETSRPLIEAARHELILDLPDEPLPLDADPVRVAQVLSNLLNNSARYTGEGGTIRLSTRRDGADAVVSVRDNGMGISAEMLPKVFDMFTQANRIYTRANGGLGIGLTLVRSIVDLHGGTVEARSEGPGRGSEFVVRLPLALAPSERPGPTPSNGHAAIGPRRILVVDDNRDAAESLGTLLRFLGADVRIAEDGEEALESIRSYRPSVVFLDIGLPRMDGYEVARRTLDEMDGHRPTLIALTGWGQDENRQRSREAGIDYHLVKPVDLNALQSLLEALSPTRE